jgi:hypothetical protein
MRLRAGHEGEGIFLCNWSGGNTIGQKFHKLYIDKKKKKKKKIA